jgi:hypothetical protein
MHRAENSGAATCANSELICVGINEVTLSHADVSVITERTEATTFGDADGVDGTFILEPMPGSSKAKPSLLEFPTIFPGSHWEGACDTRNESQ